jgi:hypothetical protein
MRLTTKKGSYSASFEPFLVAISPPLRIRDKLEALLVRECHGVRIGGT